MMKMYLLLISAILTLACCNGGGQKPSGSHINNSENNNSNGVPKPEVVEILLDTIYNSKSYKLQLKALKSQTGEQVEKSTVFTLLCSENKRDSLVFQDTIFSEAQDVKFEDYNNDQVKDILIQNSSDVRSNWTYYLYLVDLSNNRITKVRGFEEIKNPRYVPKYNLIDNAVISGKNWTGFYRIQGDSITDFGIVIYKEGDSKSYEKEYRRAISTILKEKNNR